MSFKYALKDCGSTMEKQWNDYYKNRNPLVLNFIPWVYFLWYIVLCPYCECSRNIGLDAIGDRKLIRSSVQISTMVSVVQAFSCMEAIIQAFWIYIPSTEHGIYIFTRVVACCGSLIKSDGSSPSIFAEEQFWKGFPPPQSWVFAFWHFKTFRLDFFF